MARAVQTPQDQLTYQIIGCAMAVHRSLGPGLREDTYQRALEARLEEGGISYEAQKLFEVYDGEQGGVLIGYYVPDLVVAQQVVVEIKALSGLDSSHMAQVIGYFAVTGYTVGLLINFGTRSLQWRRLFPPTNLAQHRVNRQWLFVPDWLKDR